MNNISILRQRLGVSQSSLALALGLTQANISHYERGSQSIPPDIARKLIEYASTKGVLISYNDIYGELLSTK